MGEWGSLTFQLPSVREGYVGPSSTEFQALLEAQAVLGGSYVVEPLRLRYIARLLSRRRAAEAERARKRLRRDERWREIASGEREPELWAAVVERSEDEPLELANDPYGNLLDAVQRVAQDDEPAEEATEEAVTVAEAAKRLGISTPALRMRINRNGTVRVLRRDEGVRVPVAEVERLRSKVAPAALGGNPDVRDSSGGVQKP